MKKVPYIIFAVFSSALVYFAYAAALLDGPYAKNCISAAGVSAALTLLSGMLLLSWDTFK